MHRTFNQSPSHPRVFVACLLSFMVLIAPLASVMATTSRDRQAPASPGKTNPIAKTPVAEPAISSTVNNATTAQPLAPLAPSISATLVDSFPVHPSGKANPGDTINYTATVTNNGAASPADDALNVAFGGSLDANTTLVPGSIHASPIAFNDSYDWVGNTTLDTSARALPSVTSNDVAVTDTFTLTTISNGATTLGGTVTLSANGHFVYTPEAGDTGADSFTYTITNNADGTLVGTGVVTINLTGRVWYVQNALTNGDGTSTNPFNSPAAASTAANQSTDIIYILSDLANPLLNGNFSLEGGQQLLGQGVALVVGSTTLFPAGAAPTTTNSAGNGITLNNTNGGNTVRGLIVGDTSGVDIIGTGGTGFGTLTLNSVTLNGTGRPLDLNTGNLAATFDSITTTSASGGAAISLAGLTGTMSVTGGTSITHTGTQGISVGTTTADVNFGNTTISGGSDGVSLQNNSSGTRTFGTLGISGNTGAGFLHAVGGGAVTVTGATTITNPGGVGIDIQNSNANLSFAATTVNKGASSNTGVNLANNATRIITFSTLSVTTNSGTGVFATGGGTFNVTNGVGSQINSIGPALNLSGMILGVNFTTVTSTNSPTQGIFVGTSSGTLTVNNGVSLATSIQNPNARGIELTNSPATFNFANTQVNGSTTDAGVAVSGSGAVTFADLDIAPDATRRGLLAVSNGTVTSTSGTITTSGAAALDITSTALAMTLDSVTADTSGGGGSGIILTTSSGSLVVNAGALTGGAGAPFSVLGGSVGVTYSGGMTQAGAGALISVTAGHTGTLTFQTGTLSATAGTGFQFDNADGNYNFNGTNTVNGTSAGVNIVNGSNGNFTFSINTSITNPTGTSFNIDGGGGNVAFNGTITDDVGRLVSVANTTGGNKDFNEPITDGADGDGGELGVSLTNNGGATITFKGGLRIRTTTNPAFTATGGGTVNVCDENPCNPGVTGALLINTLQTTTGTALNVANTNIGANRLEFRAISAGTAATGPTNAIILNNTGAGGLTVNGTGSDGSGGTIQRTAQGALFTSTNNLVLKNMEFVNANSGNGTCNNVDDATFNNSCQAAINMDTVTTAAFTNVNVTRTVAAAAVQNGINARTVSGLTITDSTISGYGDNVNENALRLFNLTGTCSFTNSTFQNPGEHIADIRNATGTLTLTIDNVIFDDTDTSPFGAAGLSVTSSGAAVVTVNVDNSTFTRIVNAGYQTFAKGTSTFTSNFTDSTVEQLTAATGRAVDHSAQNTATHNFNINHNLKLYAIGGSAVNIFGINDAQFNGRINNNPDIRLGGVGSPGTGINVHPEDNSDGLFDIMNNVITQVGKDNGITVLTHGDGGAQVFATMDATITGNTITLVSNGLTGGSYIGGLFGIQAQGGSNANDQVKTCADIRNNAVSATPNPINNTDNIAFRARAGSTAPNLSFLYLEGFNTSASVTWNNNGNTPINSTSVNNGSGGTISAPPAGAPYFGLCRQPAHANAIYIPFKKQNDNLAKGDSVVPASGMGTVLDFSEVTSGISSENLLAASQVAASSEVIAPLNSIDSNRIESVVVVDQKSAVVAQASVNNNGSTVTTLLNSLGNRTSKRSEVRSHHASIRRATAQPAALAVHTSMTTMAPLAGENVPVNIGTLPAGKTVTIKFAAVVSATPNAAQVSMQGTISGSNFASVLTDDPSVGGANDPTVTPIALPDLTIQKTHTGDFTQGEVGQTYTITVTNSGEFNTFGTITVTDTLPAGLTPTAPNGAHNGWSCSIAGQLLTCTRSDANAPGALPTITLTVDVASNAAASITNTAAVSGGGEVNTGNNSDDDPTTVIAAPDLSINKQHTGDFTQGDTNKQYTITVTNNGPGAVQAGNTVTVTDNLPAGLTATAFSGPGWTCDPIPALSCTRSDTLASGNSYPDITLTVNVANNATNPVINQATVSGGGDVTAGNNSDSDSTTVNTAAAIANDDNYFTPKDTPLNIAAPGVLINDTGNPAPTAVAISNGPTTAGGTVTLNTDGSFLYTPLTGFEGPDSFTYTATNANGNDTATVNISVSDAVFINEVLFSPPGTDAPNEYIELRGVANSTIPAGTYLVAIEGDTAENPGDVQTIINLSGLTLGSNGFLVFLQNGNTYTTNAGATVLTSTTTGFGGLPGGIWSADGGATDLEDDSVTFMVIQTTTAPLLADDIDANNDATPDGAVFAGWTVGDTIGALDGTSATDSGYGALNFVQGGSGQVSGTMAVVGFVTTYVGRRGDTTGSAVADWVATGPLGGAAPNWTLGNNPEPPSFANKPLNHIGSSNFTNAPPLNTVPGAQATDEDTPLVFTGATQISIADPDAGTANVQVTLTGVNGTFTLSGTAGLAFSTGDGTNDALMVFSGSITNINNALNNLTFTPALNFSSPPVASLTILTDDLGNTGTDGAKTDSDTINITVGAINDPPSFTKGADQTVNEDAGPQTVNGWATSISQGPGESGQTLTFSVSVTGTTGNLAFSSAPAINATTGNLTYTTSANTNGTANLSVTLSDNGSNVPPNSNTSAAQPFVITVNAVNDAPTFQILSNPPAVNEDAGAQTVNSFATNFQPGPVTATDEIGQTLVGYTVTQTGTTGNLTFTSGPSINNAGTLTYTPTNNTSGTATFNAVATDSGSGTAPNVNQSAPVSFTITVNGQNDAPVLDNTGNMSLTAINEDVPNASNPGTLVSGIIASAGGDRITDVDAGALEGIAVIAVNNTNGTWQFSIDNGTNWTPFGAPSASSARLLAANATTRVRFVPNANFNGTVNPGITFRAWDQTSGTNGNTADPGAGGGSTAFSTATDTASIVVNPVNDQPTANAQSVSTNEQTALPITLTGTDVETAAGSLIFNVTVQPTNGVLSGTGANRTYTPNANFTGPDSFQFTVTDTGDGSSPALTSAPATVSITVNGVNDAPVNTVPGAQTVIKNGTLTFSAANANLISIADIDAAANAVRVTLTATNGTITLDGTTGLSFTVGDGTSDATMTFTGTITNINNALDGMTFTPTLNFDGAASLQIVTNDQGNTGSGGALSDTDTVTINVVPGGTLAFSAATYTVAEDGGSATITVNRTGGTTGEARVDFATSNGSANSGQDYTTTSGTLIFPDGVTTQTFNVPIINDTVDEANETVNLTLSNVTGTGALGTPATAVLTITDNDPPTFQLDASTYNVNEDGIVLTATVTRAGDLSQAVRVDYATSDMSGLNNCSQITGNASQRCDYATVVGTLRFGVGETSRVIHISIVDDVYIEGAEIFTLTLFNNSGGDLGTPATATITINDNDVGPAANPIDNDAFWIRQMYIDILGREPEPGAVNAWLAILNNCPNPTDCDRIAVALGFLRSEEFHIRGFFVYRFYAASLGRVPIYSEFVPDHARMSGFLSPAELELNKTAFVDEFMNRTEFKNIYDPTIGNPTAYVDTLLQRAGLPNHPRRTDWINGLTSATLTRAQVLRELVDSNEVFLKFVNEAFVVMNYFGLLRRTADAQYLVWIQILNQTGDERVIVNGFINSSEYRLRFGP